jgi:hypothetical protein
MKVTTWELHKPNPEIESFGKLVWLKRLYSHIHSDLGNLVLSLAVKMRQNLRLETADIALAKLQGSVLAVGPCSSRTSLYRRR